MHMLPSPRTLLTPADKRLPCRYLEVLLVKAFGSKVWPKEKVRPSGTPILLQSSRWKCISMFWHLVTARNEVYVDHSISRLFSLLSTCTAVSSWSQCVGNLKNLLPWVLVSAEIPPSLASSLPKDRGLIGLLGVGNLFSPL